MDTTALGEHAAASRRRFLQAVGLGGALSALPLIARSAGAQGTSTTEEATTTTEPPKRPTEADVELLGFVQTVELAAVEAYEAALARSEELSIPDDVLPVLEVFREHHQAYAGSLSGFLGQGAPNVPNQAVLDEFGDASGSLEEVLEAAASLEWAASSTHTTVIGDLEGTDGAELLASIAPVEARQATVLRALARDELVMPTGDEDLSNALNPDDFPVE